MAGHILTHLLQRLEQDVTNVSVAGQIESILTNTPNDEKYEKYFFFLLLKAKTDFAFATIARLGIARMQEGVYPGIVIAAVEAGATEAALHMWSSWMPENLSARDLEGTLSAFARVAPLIGRSEIAKAFLCRLILALPAEKREKVIEAYFRQNPSVDEIRSLPGIVSTGLQMMLDSDSRPDWLVVRGYVLGSTCVAERDRTKIRLKIQQHVNVENFAVLNPKTFANSEKDLLAIIDHSAAPASRPLSNADTRSGAEFVEASFADISAIAEISKSLSFDFDNVFTEHIIAGWLRCDVQERCLGTPALGLNDYELFALVFRLTRGEKIYGKKIRHKMSFLILKLVFSKLPCCRSVGTHALQTFQDGDVLGDFLEEVIASVFDSLITSVRRKHTSLTDVSDLVEFLIAHSPSTGVTIDLIREILRAFEPRNIPTWSLRAMSFVTRGLASRPVVSGEPSDKLTGEEMICNEIIGRIRYCIDVDVGGRQAAMGRSIFAILISINAVEALRRFPEAQIVRFCDIMNQLRWFIHPDADVAGNEIRIIASLQVVDAIFRSHASVIEFFVNRIEAEVFAVILNHQISNTETGERLRKAVLDTLGLAEAKAGIVTPAVKDQLLNWVGNRCDSG